MDRVYMDYAATTPLDDAILQQMLPYMKDAYGNASSFHSFGRQAAQAVDEARAKISQALNAAAGRIYFTSGGSEADNWAIKGYARRWKKRGRHIITSKVEHHALLHACKAMEREDFEVTYLEVDPQGRVRPEDLRAALRPDTILVSIMLANNEVGTVQPVAELAQITHEHSKAVFHTDAVQAVGAIAVDIESLGVDMMSISAHKCYGPKGVGGLFVKKGVALENLMDGGGQEWGHRAGTYNTAAIVGMGAAIQQAVAGQADYAREVAALRDELVQKVLTLPNVQQNAAGAQLLPGIANFSFAGIEGEGLLLVLDLAGVAASSGSACASGSLEPSHVLAALGLERQYLHSSVRFSLGKHSTRQEVETAFEAIKAAVEKLRWLSPVYDQGKEEYHVQ